MPLPSLAAFAELVHKIDAIADPRSLLLTPALELQHEGWRAVALPPVVSGGVVGLTLGSAELGLLFVVIMVPFAAFFYWVISNLRRVRRTLHDINGTLQIMVGRDPVAMKRIQEAHRERLARTRPR